MFCYDNVGIESQSDDEKCDIYTLDSERVRSHTVHNSKNRKKNVLYKIVFQLIFLINILKSKIKFSRNSLRKYVGIRYSNLCIDNGFVVNITTRRRRHRSTKISRMEHLRLACTDAVAAYSDRLKRVKVVCPTIRRPTNWEFAENDH